MIIIEGKDATYCGNPSILYNAHSYVKTFVEKAKEDSFFIISLSPAEKEKYKNDFELIDSIYGLSEEEQKYYKKFLK